MQFQNFSAALAASLALGLAASSASAAPDPKGTWIDDQGRGAIEIKDCGGKLCGHVVWTKEASDATRGCGKQIIGDVAPQGSGLWDGGWIYSPERKRRYDVELKALDDGNLRVKGYAGSKFFSKTMVWTKAPDDLTRCGTSIEAKAEPVPTPAAKSEANEPPASAPEQAAGSGSTALLNGSPPKPKSEPAPATAESKQPAPGAKEEGSKEPEVAANDDEAGDDDPLGGLMSKLEEIAPGKGYGLKETGDGNCKLKIPYVSLTFKCKE